MAGLPLLLAALAARADAPAVRITAVEHVGRPHFLIETPAATWLYDARGGGFSGLLDPAGNDWIGFLPEPLGDFPESAAAGFRGMPNLVHGGEEGGAGHPGFDRCVTEVESADRLVTRSLSGRWRWSWTFTANEAVFRMEQADPDRAWWFLYEGNPGGRWDPAGSLWGLDDGVGREERPGIGDQLREPCTAAWFGHVDSPWVLRLELRELESLPRSCNLWWMGSEARGAWRDSRDGMLVFGFGRGAGTRGPQLRGPATVVVRLALRNP